MIYLDSSAIIKLVAPEPESAAFAEWLAERARESVFTSKLSEVEVPRALRRNHSRVLAAVSEVMRRLYRVEINDAVRATAGAYRDPNLRSLEAIHLATAEEVGAFGKTVTAFVTYDKRLGAAAVQAGLTVAAPGRRRGTPL